MLSVVIASRGLIHSRTIEAVLKNTRGWEDVEYIFTHNLPIPDCFNELVKQAHGNLIWFVEEDVGFPDYVLDDMRKEIANGADVVALDYPVGRDGDVHCTKILDHGEFGHCGMGCLLVKREVLDETMPFRSDIVYDPHFNKLDIIKPHEYGMQDIHFSRQLVELKKKIALLKYPGVHYRLVELGEFGKNDGVHKILIRDFTGNRDA